MMPFLIAAAIILLYLLNSIKILKEYERAVVFRLGRVRHEIGRASCRERV